MAKISEMTLEELQDYALQLEQDAQARTTEIADKDSKISELQGLNLDLQRRNKALFMQVEQQGTDHNNEGGDGGNDPEQPPKSCEDVAKELTGSIIK